MASIDFSRSYLLTFSCTDRVGIVSAVSSFLAERDGFILDSQQFADLESGRFFMRVLFKGAGPRFSNDVAELDREFSQVANAYGLQFNLSETDRKRRIVVAVSKGNHCLADLLHRWSSNSLPVEIAAIVSNHENCRKMADWYGVPYHYLPVTNENREEQEQAILDVMASTDCELLVLARYMQILSEGMTVALEGRCINIHHSFLPSFKGSQPYHRAHDRGVKLIGATAHFVTRDLDEGPIIEQAVERVDHRATVNDMIRIGKDIEARVLARAVSLWGEHRIFQNGMRTVVFG